MNDETLRDAAAQPEAASSFDGPFEPTPASALAELVRIQECPQRHLSRGDALTLRRALAFIRDSPDTPSHVQLPEQAWRLLEPHAGMELLFARRIAAQVRQHHLHEERFAIARLAAAAVSPARFLKVRTGQWLLRSRYHSWYLGLLRLAPNAIKPGLREYERWQAREQAITDAPEALRQSCAGWDFQPCVSIILAAHNTRMEWLMEAVDSVRAQVYGKWELCIVDDDSADPRIHRFLESLPAADARMRVYRSPVRLGESGAFNYGAGMATGEFVACLDHDDLLNPEALYRVVEALQHQPDADVIYTDEDFIDETGYRMRPHFKPDWSPRLLDACMYLGHLVVVRRCLFEAIGGFRSQFDGAQDYDLALRATERARHVLHVPLVAYHWRMHSNSVAAGPQNKPRTHTVGQSVLEDALARRQQTGCAVASADVPSLYFVERSLTVRPAVDAVLISSSKGDRQPDLMSRTGYRPFRVITAWGNRGNEAGMTGRGHLANTAVKGGSGDVLVFLSDWLQPLDAFWLERLVRQLSDRHAAVAGCKVVNPNGAIIHAGVALALGESAGNPGRNGAASPHWLWLDVPREVSAVDFDGLAIRRCLFEELNGFDTALAPEYQAIDLCLRARERGGAVVIETRAVLRQNGPDAASGRFLSAQDWAGFVEKWRDLLCRPDPYFTPNLRPDREEIRLA